VAGEVNAVGTVPSARQLALDVLLRVLHGGYLAPALSAALDKADLEGHERSLATDLTYGVVRHLPQLDHALAPLLKAPEKLPPQVLGALRLGAYELLHRGTPRYAAVNAWVAQVKSREPRLAGLVNAVLRRVEPREGQPPHVAAALPEWLLDELQAALGPQRAVQAAAGMLQPEPLWLTLFGAEALNLLTLDGAEASPLVPGAPFPASFRVRSPLPLAQLAAFRLGNVQPQNPSSLQVALALGAEHGSTVYDLASGRGVKSAVFAAQGAQVTAFELSAERSQAAASNLARLGLQARHLVADLKVVPNEPQAPFVILDAPCSGTGTLRGHPEIKLRLTAADVTELAALQGQLLASAAQLVAPGGVLLYAVCALTKAEGPDVIEALLRARPDLIEEPAPLAAPHGAPASGGPGSYILPTGGLDGFYLARLRRAG